MVTSKNKQLYTHLNNGIEMPLLGLGVYDMHGEEAVHAISDALEIGYRLIDTAEMYNNEKEVGKAITNSNISREELFITSKVNNTSQGYDETLKAFDKSLKLLGVEYLDLYLIHWPIKGKRKDTWRAIEKIYADGRAKAIGTGNYLLPFLKELESYSTIVPTVNQIEFSPYLFLKDELEYCKANNIQLQAYTPLLRGKKFNDPRLISLAEKYGKTPAQIILRWAIQQGISSIPKSSNINRLKENFDIFNFSIDGADILFMNSFDEQLRIIDDPMLMY
jgi:diketogulonate reductase-like aldo/keto reductase